MSNISKVKKNQCTGCGACKNVCPYDAITMLPDTYGFLYPNVDLNKCINCNLCLNSCPTLNIHNQNDRNYVCKVAMANDNIRKISSSGGIFSLLAEFILSNNGVVIGAAFEESTIVKHIIIDKIEDLNKLRGSKYVQSAINDIYTKVKEILNSNKLVLFSGTPCQIAGLYSFLNKSYSNLYTVDIMCHGVSSQGMFDKYLSENFKDEKINYISFRDKVNGWNYEFSLKIATDKKEYCIPYQESSYYSLFLNGISLRKSCYNCKYATLPRIGDITLGDFWEIKSFNTRFDDNLGTSMVLLNNKKGEDLYFNITDKLKLNENISIEIAKKGNGTLTHPTLKNHLIEQFENNYNTMTLNNNFEQIQKYKFDFAIYNFWWTINYGATLTAFALQKLLLQLGKTSTLISYLYDRNPNEVFFNQISEKFAREHLTYTNIYNSEKELVDLNNITDKFIVGSDQVFRDEYFKDCCFLNFVNYKKVKIAFSASFGTDSFNISSKLLKKYKFLLSRFDYISVREVSGVDICKNIFNITAKQIIDPVFLINKDIWFDLINESVLKESKYILCYILDENEVLNKKIKDYAEHKGLKIIKIDSTIHSIQDWLYLIKNAELIVTDSFHGLCFSLIFNKNVNCFINVNRGADRFKSLQEILHIPQIVFFNDCNTYDIEQHINSNFDYNEINTSIQKAQNFGINELNKIIKIEKIINQKDEQIDENLLKKYNKKKFKFSFFIKKNIYKLLFILFRREKFYEKYIKYKNK